MNKIKVCHIITKLELGGAQQNTLYTVSHLDKSKFEVSLIAGTGGILDAEAGKFPDVAVHFTPALIRRAYPWADLAGFFSLCRLLKKIKPDIVHTHSSKAGILGRWAAKFAGVPVIIHTFHGFGFHDFQPWIVRKFFILLEKLTALISTKLVAVSTDNIKKALENGIGTQEQYALIRSGIDVSIYKNAGVDKDKKRKELGLKPGQQIVLTIGPFKPQKNLQDFISTAQLVAAKEPSRECAFLIVGDGAQRQLLESQIKASNLQGTVQLLGWRRDVPELLALADLFVMTSLWEGLPRAILEAMSSGLPVIANAVDGVREIIEDGVTGFLVRPRDTEKMADLIGSLLGDPVHAREMGDRGRKLITEQYDIRFMVKQQEDLYQNTMKIK